MKRHEYTSSSQKTIHFLIGFFGWYIVNGVLWGGSQVVSSLVYGGLQTSTPGTDVTSTSDLIGIAFLVFSCVVLLLNLGTMIYFGFTRYWIALGELSAFASLLILAICASVAFLAICFTSFSGSGGF